MIQSERTPTRDTRNDTPQTTNRNALASELADIESRQKIIVAFGEKLAHELQDDDDMRGEISKILEDDRKNEKLIDTVILQYGLSASPKPLTRKHLAFVRDCLDDTTFSTLEKLGQYTLLKHNQTLCCHLVQRVAQVSPPDMKNALSLVNTINIESQRHEGVLASILETVGLRTLCDREPQVSVMGRIKDFAQAAVGMVGGSDLVKPASEMDITQVLKLEHIKVRTLFKEIQSAPNAEMAQGFFLQLYTDLMNHAVAEQQAFYEPIKNLPGLDDLISTAEDDHLRLREHLDVMRSLPALGSAFNTRLESLRALVEGHLEREEDDVFSAVRSQLDKLTLVRMSEEFTRIKTRLIDEQAGSAHQLTG